MLFNDFISTADITLLRIEWKVDHEGEYIRIFGRRRSWPVWSYI